MFPCCGGCHILTGSGWQDAVFDICQFLARYRIQQINVGVAYVAVIGIN
jgi:hypothetical protein